MSVMNIPAPNEKQALFFKARQRFVAYGGARGGGKSWAVRHKAFLMALNYPGITILILRRTFPELRKNHIWPLVALTKGLARYKESDKALSFPNGSVILFGYCQTDADVTQYQGNEYDVIFLDEATQFTEYQYSALTGSLRGANRFPKRFYLTCNPGGVGHAWVKRLFVDRQFRGSEKPEDYVFIPAKATDNPVLLEMDPGYMDMLNNLPPGLREAWRDGSWEVFAGQYFTEWDPEVHVVKEPFTPPGWWRWYVTMDYGLDMLAAYLIAVDERGRAVVTDEIYEGKDLGITEDGVEHKGLTVYEAAQRLKEMAAGHRVTAWLAPGDLWNKQSQTGKSTAQLFAEHGVVLTKAQNDRVAGWLAVKEWLRVVPEEGIGVPGGGPGGAAGASPRPTEGQGRRAGLGSAPTEEIGAPEEVTARLRVFPHCVNLIRTLPLLQYDKKRPSDVANEPHELTHGPDAIRYFCASWTLEGEMPVPEEEAENRNGYDEYLHGGDAGEGYLDFGG